MPSPLTGVYIEIGLLIVGIVIVVILFSVEVAPFNAIYKYRDPRTWEPVTENPNEIFQWLQPDFDYGPYTRSEPTSEIIEMYNGLIVALGGTPVVY